MRHAITIALLLMMLVACGKKDEVATTNQQPAQPAPAVSAKTMSPEQLGELGAQMSKQPERAAELLSQHGMTPESFEKEIRRITEDPEASRRYAEAYKRARA